MTTKQILTIMQVIAWMAFIGACIKTGAILYSFLVSMFINPAGAKNLHLGLNLSDLYAYNTWHYVTVVFYILFVSGLKASICYLVIKIFLKLNLTRPFSADISALISRISYVALGIGALTLIATGYSEWLIKRGVTMPDLEHYTGGTGEFLFFGGIVFIISLIFKRGLEIQTENELTV